jgi:hypothetical protein
VVSVKGLGPANQCAQASYVYGYPIINGGALFEPRRRFSRGASGSTHIMEELSWGMIHFRNQCRTRPRALVQRLCQGTARSFWLVCCVLIGLVGLLSGHHAGAQEPAAERARRIAVLIDVDGAIGPASVRHVETAIAEAEARRAELVILQLDTPGGLVTSMREMVAAIIASRVPVVGYVAPSGARAASAGTFIIYATHIAAMAPGTNIGAATPITMGMPGLPETDPSKKKDNEKIDNDKTDKAAPKDPAKAKGGRPQGGEHLSERGVAARRHQLDCARRRAALERS